MRKRVVNVDYDSGERFDTYEEDDVSLTFQLSRSFQSQTTRPTTPQRLYDDQQAAAYLGISRSALRAMVANGDLKRVQLPSTDGRGETRRLLIDQRDLDKLIESSKG